MRQIYWLEKRHHFMANANRDIAPPNALQSRRLTRWPAVTRYENVITFDCDCGTELFRA